MRPPSSVPEIVADKACRAAGPPVWHPRAGLLCWTDMHDGRLFSYDPAAAKSAAPNVAPRVLLCAPGDGDTSLLLLADGGLAAFRAPDHVEALAGNLPLGPDTVLSAAAVDRRGRLYCALRSSSEKSGGLFQMLAGGAAQKVPVQAGWISGLDFDAGGNLFCCDAASREVLRFSTDKESFADRQVLFQVPQSLGAPHGLAVDAKGHLWVAAWGGGCILRLSPAGKEEQRIYFTARLVGGLVFGGPDLRELYVVTSGAEDRKANGPGAGALFRLRPGMKGAPKLPVSGLT